MSFANCFRAAAISAPYSKADFSSWIEQGPATTSRRSSSPRRIFSVRRRASSTKPESRSPSGHSCMSTAGWMRGSISAMRRSSVRWERDTELRVGFNLQFPALRAQLRELAKKMKGAEIIGCAGWGKKFCPLFTPRWLVSECELVLEWLP